MKLKKFISIIIAAAMLFSLCAVEAFADTAESAALTFTDSGVEETLSGSGYAIAGTALTITAAGVYRISGSCAEGSIVVSKGLSGVTLILDNLTLASSSTAPIVVKKSSDVSIHLEGTSTLTDNENPEDENSSDPEIAEAFEGAAIKIKSGASVTFCGDGDLNIVANAKNGIKGGSTAALVFNQSGTVTVTGSGKYYGGTLSGAAVNNGIACDGSIVFNSGSYVIKAAGDGVKSAPDATDEAEGTTIDNESAGAITVNGGEFDIDCDGDGFQADASLTINGGTFDVQTWKGSGVWNDTLADANSCKGLKAAGDRAEEAGLVPELTVTGGSFTLNTGDDALHSDGNVTVTGGVFTISAGDDGIHADETLTLGGQGGRERDPDVTITSSYEGLEGSTVYIYSGRFYVVASDDGVNAAGGSSNGSDPVGPGQGGGHGHDPWTPGSSGNGGSSNYNIYIYGGDLYVDCNGDGLDSNGGLYLYGGRQAVFSMRSGGDNSALDADGTVLIQGATIFTAGTAGMDGRVQSSWIGSGQKYSASATSYSAGKIINASAGGSVLMSYSLPRNVNYVMASWPASVSGTTPSFSTATSVTACLGGSWSHAWDAGTVTTAATATSKGVMTYTCSKCGATETQTIPALVTVPECDHAFEGGEATDEGFTVTFAGDEGVSSITVYETQDYSGASVSVAADGTAVSRSSATGAPDSTGDGQLNFTVVLAEGYAISGISAVSGTYKNIKGPSDTGLANTYRITKITADTTVTITTVECEHGTVADGTTPEWTWSDGCGKATLTYICADCGNSVALDGAITSVLTNAETITFTATASIGEAGYTDVVTAAPFTATFIIEGGDAAVNIYYTQDYASADEEGVSTAVARDSDSGCPVVTGDGQINFAVVAAEGFEVESVAVAGGYKNLKDISDSAGANSWRVTKVTGDLTITVTVKSASAAVLIGDMDKDGEITVADALAALRIAAKLAEETEEALATGDVDGDGSITVSDALRILRVAAGLAEGF